MIRINLLPRELHYQPRRPIGWMAVTVVGSLVLLAAMVVGWWYQTRVIPSLEARLAALQEIKVELEQRADELEQIEIQSTELERQIDAVSSLYGRRVIWSRLLQESKRALLAVMSSGEADGDSGTVGMGLSRIAGYGRRFVLEGRVTAREQRVVEERVQALLDELCNDAILPGDTPEPDSGLASIPFAELLTDDSPRLVRIEPLEKDISAGEKNSVHGAAGSKHSEKMQTDGAPETRQVFTFEIEMELR